MCHHAKTLQRCIFTRNTTKEYANHRRRRHCCPCLLHSIFFVTNDCSIDVGDCVAEEAGAPRSRLMHLFFNEKALE